MTGNTNLKGLMVLKMVLSTLVMANRNGES